MDPVFARNRLSAWMDGELSGDEAREVERALAEFFGAERAVA